MEISNRKEITKKRNLNVLFIEILIFILVDNFL